MKTITMTELNQRISAVSREVTEGGETIQVTNRGKPVLRLVPEPGESDDSLRDLITAGLADLPRGRHDGARPRHSVELSHDIDELIDWARSDREL